MGIVDKPRERAPTNQKEYGAHALASPTANREKSNVTPRLGFASESPPARATRASRPPTLTSHKPDARTPQSPGRSKSHKGHKSVRHLHEDDAASPSSFMRRAKRKLHGWKVFLCLAIVVFAVTLTLGLAIYLNPVLESRLATISAPGLAAVLLVWLIGFTCYLVGQGVTNVYRGYARQRKAPVAVAPQHPNAAGPKHPELPFDSLSGSVLVPPNWPSKHYMVRTHAAYV